MRGSKRTWDGYTSCCKCCVKTGAVELLKFTTRPILNAQLQC